MELDYDAFAQDFHDAAMAAVNIFTQTAQEMLDALVATVPMFAALYMESQHPYSVGWRELLRLVKRTRKHLRRLHHSTHHERAQAMLTGRTQSFDTYYQRQVIRAQRRRRAA